MRSDEFVKFAQEYWRKLSEEGNAKIVEEIARVISGASPAGRRVIKEHLEKTIPPSRLLGVADLYEAARTVQAPLKRRELRGFDITCDCCGRMYTYTQGVRDVCAHCGFPAIWMVERKWYEKSDSGKAPKEWLEAYSEVMAKHAKVAATKKDRVQGRRS